MAGLSYIDTAHGALDAFLAWFTEHYSTEQQRSACVLLPNRRLARALQFACAEKQILPPKIIALGGLTHTDCLALFVDNVAARQEILAVKPALPADILRHHMVRFVMQYQQRKQGGASVQRALAMSDELISLLEKCDESGLTLDEETLQHLAPSYFARHWRHASEFLGIITAYLPVLLEEEGGITTTAQQRLFAETIARHADALSVPCVLFGSSGSVPYVRTLMQALGKAPNGYVMVAGGINGASGEGQANYYTQQTLVDVGLSASPLLSAQKASPPRALLCTNEEEEARLIATLMRETAHEQAQAMLVTKDIALMRRVAAQLLCHNIVADSPSIARMDSSAMGQLLLTISRLMADKRNMSHMHALLNHPWLGADDAEYTEWRQQVDIKSFRGTSSYKPAGDVVASEAGEAIDHWLRYRLPKTPNRASLDMWCEQVKALVAIAHMPDAPREEITQWLDALAELTPVYGDIHARDFAALVAGQLQSQSQQAVQPTHPNLRMLTPVEARLMHADRVILGAFHDGVWGNATGNAWLNDAQLRTLGLPTRAAQQSLTRHDIAMHVGAKEVFFTRAAMVNHSPSIAYAAAHHYVEAWETGTPWHHWAEAQRHADYAPITASTPCPNATKRPTKLPVRALEVAQQNPYQLYVEHVLGLKRLDAYGEKPEAMMFGILAHRMMEMLANGEVWNGSLRDRLLQQHDCSAAEFPFWQQRLDSIAAFAHSWLAEQTGNIHTEDVIEQRFTGAALDMQLTGRIDAWFAGTHGALLVDYKTGSIPNKSAVEAGEYCQLTTYGVMMQQQAGTWPAEICYLRLPDVKNAADSTPLAWDAEVWQTHKVGLMQLMADIQNPTTQFIARPYGLKANECNEYDGISRALEVQMNAA